MLLLLVVSFYRGVDALLAPEPPASATSASSPAPPRRGRTFVLLVDSLPFAMASDAERMPALARFRAEATWMACSGAVDQVTNPAVLAAFTGTDHFRIFGFVRNFLRGSEVAGSIFDDWRRSGLRVFVHGDDSLLQFGQFGLTYRALNNSEDLAELEDGQKEAFADAIRAYEGHEYDVTVFLMTVVDAAAHRYEHYRSEYLDAFAITDAWIDRAMAAMGPDDTLMIFGDHGHNSRGVHAMGLDIHTFIGIRGPGFARGVALPEVPITVVRYLLSWATGVPLGASYEGPSMAEALVSTGPRPEPFVAARTAHRAAPPLRASTALAIALGLGVSLWLSGVRRSWGAIEAASVMATATPLFFAPSHLWLLYASVLAGLAGVVAEAFRRKGPASDLWVALIAGVLSASMVRYGVLLGQKVLGEDLASAEGGDYVLPALVLGFLLACVVGPDWGSLVAVGAAMLLLPTTDYTYGWTALFASMLLLLAFDHGVLGLRRRYRHDRLRAPRDEWLSRIVALVVIAWILQRYGETVGWDFLFQRWEPWFFRFAAIDLPDWQSGSFFAKVLLFVRFRRSPALHATAAFSLALLSGYELGYLPRTTLWNLPVIAGLFGAALLAPRALRDRETAAEVRDQLLLASGLLAFLVFVRNEKDTYLWLNLLLAAVALIARMVQPLAPVARRHAHALLLLFGVVIAGWVDVCWSTNQMEWEVLSSALPAETIRSHVILFLPVLVGRYLVPVWLVRLVLRSQLGSEDPETLRLAFSFLGVKTALVAATTFGVGIALGGTGFFLEGLQQTALLLILGMGLLGSRRDPAAPPERRESSPVFGVIAAVVRRLPGGAA